MGQCGCSDTAPMYRFPGPDGVHYGIQIYPSCHYCTTPAGVDLYRFDDQGADEWLDGVEDAPFIPYDAEQPTAAQLAIPVVDPAALAKAIRIGQDEDTEYNGLDQEDYVEIAEEDLRHALPEAVWQTLNAWQAEVRSVPGDQPTPFEYPDTRR